MAAEGAGASSEYSDLVTARTLAPSGIMAAVAGRAGLTGSTGTITWDAPEWACATSPRTRASIGLEHDLTNKLLHGQYDQYISKTQKETKDKKPGLTAKKIDELAYGARLMN
ncbi:hypothetical protein BG844_08085 [Couchioplanes caeruleus subsp. caeruleus]|uniref:Uncharacterized protein n=1 Tax=Couchioplanes caeruleus subsp. caeruleus TaxID=56427 RepID=A0A1K0FPQ6_9ACTN|nr:hypothetical protein BG844_08085 [Couchioplanes caeruleus subsp. caeruleus]